MPANPACERFLPLLSPYIDGELATEERGHLERHLAACRACTGRVADLRAESGLIRVGLEMAADEVDFSGFSQAVLARITPERPPLLERWRLSVSEFLTHQRGMLYTSMATAAVLLAVILPVLLMREGVPTGYAQERMEFQAMDVAEEAHVKPVVLQEKGAGATIIWFDGPAQQPKQGGPADPHDDEEEDREEDLRLEREGKGLGAQPGDARKPAVKEGEL
jgi:anti-sigma factor RsiW